MGRWGASAFFCCGCWLWQRRGEGEDGDGEEIVFEIGWRRREGESSGHGGGVPVGGRCRSCRDGAKI